MNNKPILFKLSLLFLVVMLFSCNKPGPAGYWLEANNFQSPLLIKFDKEKAIFYNTPCEYDTFSHNFSWNSLEFENADTILEYNYDFINDTLILSSNSKTHKLVKAKSEAFYKDLIGQLPMKIDLPEGAKRAYNLLCPFGIVYIGFNKSAKSPVIYFNNKRIENLDGFGYEVLASIEYEEDYYGYTLIICADKQIPHSIIKDIYKEMRSAGIYKIFLLTNLTTKTKYFEISGFGLKLFCDEFRDCFPAPYVDSVEMYWASIYDEIRPTRQEEIIMPPGFYPPGNKIIYTKLTDTSVLFDNKSLEYKNINSYLKKEMKLLPKKKPLLILYDADPDVTFNQVIHFRSNAYQAHQDILEEYAQIEYGRSLDKLPDSLYRELRNKIIMWTLNADKETLDYINRPWNGRTL